MRSSITKDVDRSPPMGYAEFLEASGTFGLLLDTTVTIAGGAHFGLRRTENGKLEEVALTKHEAAAIVELVITGRSLRAGDFKTLSVSSVDKVVERARKKFDLQVSRFEWRAIHTLRAATPEAKRWQFRPDALGRWGVVVATGRASSP